MKVLVSWGSKRGGTEGIAQTIGAELRRNGIEVVLKPASEVGYIDDVDAAIVGSSLYANRWRGEVRRMLARNRAVLRTIPVWLFSSGPLDDSADRTTSPPPRQAGVLVDRLGALGHMTFGGRLTPEARGYPASAMAKTRSGDWRNPDRIRAWADDIAQALPTARPGRSFDPPGGSLSRLVAYGLIGWGLCAVLMAILMGTAPTALAIAIHAVGVPLIFAAVSARYFRERGACDPVPTAFAFVAIGALLDAAVAAPFVLRSFAMFAHFPGAWLPLVLIFLVTWLTGVVTSMVPPAVFQSSA